MAERVSRFGDAAGGPLRCAHRLGLGRPRPVDRRWGPSRCVAALLRCLSEARQLLNEAVEIGVKDAEAYRLLVIIARAEGWPEEEARATLAEGQRVDSLYYPLYIEFARYLLPRWHGKRGDIERFAAEMTERLPGDDGLEAFARIAAAIHQIDVERELLFLGSYDRDLLVKASEVLRQRHEGQYDEASFAALCAWVAQDREAGRRLFSHIGQSEENDGVWPWAQHKREFRHWCKDDDFQSTGETQWLWGSVFDAENLVFAPDSRSIWCGAGYSPAAAKRIDIEERRVNARASRKRRANNLLGCR